MPGRNIAQLIVNTRSNADTEQLLLECAQRYENWFPEALIHFRQMDYQALTAVEVMLCGAPTEELRPLADSLRTFMYGMQDQLTWIHTDYDNIVPYVEVELDPEEASRLGVNIFSFNMGLSASGIFPLSRVL